MKRDTGRGAELGWRRGGGGGGAVRTAVPQECKRE